MFNVPLLKPGNQFPELPCSHADWSELLAASGVVIDPSRNEDLLQALARHGVGWVEGHQKYIRPWHDETVRESSRAAIFRRSGFIDPISPPYAIQDYALLDGGHLGGYTVRLNHIDTLQNVSKLLTPNIVLFAGQRLRTPHIDGFTRLATIALKSIECVDVHNKRWLHTELAKDPEHDNPWQRPFATERELARLALCNQYGARLCYDRPRYRSGAAQLHESIPVPIEAADEFSLSGQRVVVLNAPAKIREHAGRKKPINEARPTGRSCFYEWLELENPPRGSRVALVSGAPHTYRSWFDMLLRAAEAGRKDLQITATGTGIHPDRTMGHVLTGLGDLFINFYNLHYENGVDEPDVQPLQI